MHRLMGLRIPLAIIVLLLLGIIITIWLGTSGNIKCLFQKKHIPQDVARLHALGEVYFVPIGDFPRHTLEEMKLYYQEQYGLMVQLTSPVVPPQSAFNVERRQWVTQDLAAAIDGSGLGDPGAPDAIRIGFTDQDIYIRGVNWRYAFGRWQDNGTAILSSARMSSPWLGFIDVSRERHDARLRKMTTRYIGHLHYKLPYNDDCASVLFKTIGGPQELDTMDEDM